MDLTEAQEFSGSDRGQRGMVDCGIRWAVQARRKGRKVMKGEEEQDEDEKDEGVRVAPNMGAGGSYTQATSDLKEEEWQREEEQHSEAREEKPRWADCVEEELDKQEEPEKERDEKKQDEQFESECQEGGEEQR